MVVNAYLLKEKELCIVIPCYNQETGFPLTQYIYFISRHPEVLLCFVDDGSKDSTPVILERLEKDFEDRIDIITLHSNMGKAEAVRRGVVHCYTNYSYKYIAFLDADLSTSLEECASLKEFLKGPVEFAFGSRIMKIGSTITRSPYRFLFGRIIASIVSNVLELKVYDTQCGCKVFTRECSKLVFDKSFLSRWLFDVEIFQRLLLHYGKKDALEKMIEVPLRQWIDGKNSKVRLAYFFRLWYDLILIYRQGRQTKTPSVLKHLLHEDAN